MYSAARKTENKWQLAESTSAVTLAPQGCENIAGEFLAGCCPAAASRKEPIPILGDYLPRRFEAAPLGVFAIAVGLAELLAARRLSRALGMWGSHDLAPRDFRTPEPLRPWTVSA